MPLNIPMDKSPNHIVDAIMDSISDLEGLTHALENRIEILETEQGCFNASLADGVIDTKNQFYLSCFELNAISKEEFRKLINLDALLSPPKKPTLFPVLKPDTKFNELYDKEADNGK